jgi:hypothetical protein
MNNIFALILAVLALALPSHAFADMDCCQTKTEKRVKVNGKLGFRIQWSCTLEKRNPGDLRIKLTFKIPQTRRFSFVSPPFSIFQTEKKLCTEDREQAKRIRISVLNDPLEGLYHTYLQTSIFFPYKYGGKRLNLDKFYRYSIVSLKLMPKPKVMKTEEESNTSRNSSETKNERKVISAPGTRKETVRTRKVTRITTSN